MFGCYKEVLSLAICQLASRMPTVGIITVLNMTPTSMNDPTGRCGGMIHTILIDMGRGGGVVSEFQQEILQVKGHLRKMGKEEEASGGIKKEVCTPTQPQQWILLQRFLPIILVVFLLRPDLYRKSHTLRLHQYKKDSTLVYLLNFLGIL